MRRITLVLLLLASIPAAAQGSGDPPIPTPSDFVSACKVLAFLADQALDATPQRRGEVFGLNTSYSAVKRYAPSSGSCQGATNYFSQIRRANQEFFGGAIVTPGGGVQPLPWTHREIEDFARYVQDGLSYGVVADAIGDRLSGVGDPVGSDARLLLLESPSIDQIERIRRGLDLLEEELISRQQELQTGGE